MVYKQKIQVIGYRKEMTLLGVWPKHGLSVARTEEAQTVLSHNKYAYIL